MTGNNKIGLGTVQFGVKYGIANTEGQTPAEEVSKILILAEQNGIEIIDTASAYGTSEQTLGENNLHQFKVVSKFLPSRIKGRIQDQFDQSVSNLQIDKLYGYLAHRPLSILDSPSEWKELQQLKEKGYIDKIGFSINTQDELNALLKKKIEPDIVQIPFNLFDNRFRKNAIDLKEKGCEIHTRSTFLQGLFFMETQMLSGFFDSIKQEISYLQQTHGESLHSALLNYVLNQNFVDKVIIGVENQAQLLKNIERNNEIAKLDKSLKIENDIITPSKWPKNS